MYGLANWNEVAEHVGTKSKSHCIEHYNTIYMNSPCFPLPVCQISHFYFLRLLSIFWVHWQNHMFCVSCFQDMSHVMGKNREELLAMARGHGEVSKGYLSSSVEIYI